MKRLSLLLWALVSQTQFIFTSKGIIHDIIDMNSHSTLSPYLLSCRSWQRSDSSLVHCITILYGSKCLTKFYAATTKVFWEVDGAESWNQACGCFRPKQVYSRTPVPVIYLQERKGVRRLGKKSRLPEHSPSPEMLIETNCPSNCWLGMAVALSDSLRSVAGNLRQKGHKIQLKSYQLSLNWILNSVGCGEVAVALFKNILPALLHMAP